MELLKWEANTDTTGEGCYTDLNVELYQPKYDITTLKTGVISPSHYVYIRSQGYDRAGVHG